MRITRILTRTRPQAFGWVAGAVLFWAAAVGAADLKQTEQLFRTGDYTACIQAAEKGWRSSRWEEAWPLWLAKAQLATGQYPEALTTVTNGLERFDSSIPFLLVAYDVLNANGQTNRAHRILNDLAELAGNRARATRDAPGLVALGKAALVLEVDPKLVLENFFDQAKRLDPTEREAWLAGGELALDKSDYQLAAKTFDEALKKFPDDPDVEFGLARAYAPSDAAQLAEALEAVLKFNPNHVPALLLLADHLIDAEEYAEADKTLDRALRVNPWDPEGWAYRAVLADLRNDTNTESRARSTALKFWPSNPRVDFLIGRKLSQKYRFAEGAAHQRQALAFDAAFLPAKIQLAQDLLRLGNETEGWRLAEEVHDRDGYDVTAFNLTTLRETLAKFRTVTNSDFIVRMIPQEASLYGDRALALLGRAKQTLGDKYGLRLDQPTTVEIFADQKDFGVRTFGLPHNPGFLGVCFGHVVTANSPAADPGHAANWEAVLWHEFCHVITLGLTHNKMPRWLSEGISVFEERQANPTWGQAMNPRYREMILGQDLTPISQLSAAFLSPKSALHVQFAYFESALVVEYLVRTFGFDSLKAILLDLGNGVEINDAIARHTEPMPKLEKEFAAFARDRAKNLAPGLDWTKPKEPGRTASISAEGTNRPQTLQRLLDTPRSAVPAQGAEDGATSTNYYVLTRRATELVREQKWREAKTPLERLIRLYPNETGGSSPYVLLARACRELKETEAERAALAKLAALDDAAPDAYLRLMELDDAAKDWTGVVENAERFLAVNPLLPHPYRYLGRAEEELGRADAAIRSYRSVLLLDPPDPADVHFRLARLFKQRGDGPAAKRHALQALEEAPRFRDAQRLLLDLEKNWPAKETASDGTKL